MHLTKPVPLQAKQIFSPAFGSSGWLAGTLVVMSVATLVATGAATGAGAELPAGLPQPAHSQIQRKPDTITDTGRCIVLSFQFFVGGCRGKNVRLRSH
jgi:hypothetical protein